MARVLVGVKRVIDYAVKVSFKSRLLRILSHRLFITCCALFCVIALIKRQLN